MYKAIQRFNDGENGKPFAKDKGGATYEVGDIYPIGGFEPAAAHIKYLLGCNFQGKGPVIEEVEGGEKPLADMKSGELDAYAKEKGIDISAAKNKDEKLALILEAEKED